MGYSREVYDEALNKLQKKRIRSERELQKRRDILFLRSPRAEAIERELARSAVSAARAVFSGKDKREELVKLKEKSAALQKELSDILESLGFEKNYLEERHECGSCRDTGYIDGRMCECMRKTLKQCAYDSLNRISPLALSDFESFSLEYYSRSVPEGGKMSPYNQMSIILDVCKKYADRFPENSRNMLLQGAPGLGKTHLSLAIAKSVIDKGCGVVYVSAPDILSRLENEHFRGFESSMTDSEKILIECDLLILDDLGTEFQTKFTVSEIYRILNTRMLCSKPTIISTNLSLKDLERAYDVRTVSRILGMYSILSFTGKDIRQLKKLKKSVQA